MKVALSSSKLAAVCVLVAANALAQGPVFEVATIHPGSGTPALKADAAKVQPASPTDALRFTMRQASLRSIITSAYEISRLLVMGDDQLESTRFDIAARLPEGATRDQIPAMLRALLAERFHLTVHRETRTMPVLVLSVAKGGHKLTPVPEGTPTSNRTQVSPNSYRAEFTQRWEEFRLNFIAGSFDQPVIDQTGLKGLYSGIFERRLTTKPEDSVESQREQVRENVTDGVGSLGLQLKPGKMPIEVLVVDHADRAPTEN